VVNRPELASARMIGLRAGGVLRCTPPPVGLATTVSCRGPAFSSKQVPDPTIGWRGLPGYRCTGRPVTMTWRWPSCSSAEPTWNAGGSIGLRSIRSGTWNVARLLVEQLIVEKAWRSRARHAQPLGSTLDDEPTGPAVVSQAFWHACSGRFFQRWNTYLAGADLNWVPRGGHGADAASSDDWRSVASCLRGLGYDLSERLTLR